MPGWLQDVIRTHYTGSQDVYRTFTSESITVSKCIYLQWMCFTSNLGYWIFCMNAHELAAERNRIEKGGKKLSQNVRGKVFAWLTMMLCLMYELLSIMLKLHSMYWKLLFQLLYKWYVFIIPSHVTYLIASRDIQSLMYPVPHIMEHLLFVTWDPRINVIENILAS